VTEKGGWGLRQTDRQTDSLVAHNVLSRLSLSWVFEAFGPWGGARPRAARGLLRAREAWDVPSKSAQTPALEQAVGYGISDGVQVARVRLSLHRMGSGW